MILIDTHAHVFSQHDPCITTARYMPHYDATVEQFIAHLDMHQFTHGVLIQPSFFGTDNHVMLQAIQAYPERLKGIAVVEHTISLAELTELKSKGIVGIRLNLFGLSLPDFTHPDWKFFLSNLENLNFQIELHAPPRDLIQILPMLQHYQIHIVIDHFGRSLPKIGVSDPDYQKFLSLLNPKQHWVKVSGYYRLGVYPGNIATAQKAFQLLKEKGMFSQLIWGSDWPHTQHEHDISYEKTLHSFQQIVTDPEEQLMILGKNARKLFQF